ncbi:signal peptidase I [Niveispirillum irakense]|uniref:signal peptidase I n=1 Tax=Niveispirillum irakense TaxID=34011 RepID=UPI000684439A|nr:signal peptidase I [Niveispirillum irakense]
MSRLWKEWVLPAGLYGLAILCFNTVAWAGFHVPSESMLPTLTVGDQFYAAKYAYGWSRFSTPLVPLPVTGAPGLAGRLGGKMPERSDIVVFRSPQDSADVVKRVVGLPGDRVQVRAGRLFINGQIVPRVQTRRYTYKDDQGRSQQVTEYRESLPGHAPHLILERSDTELADNTPEYQVPPDHIFVMGDNRDNSADSRFASMGMIPVERLLGRVDRVAFTRSPCQPDGETCPGGGWWDRLARKVDG